MSDYSDAIYEHLQKSVIDFKESALEYLRCPHSMYAHLWKNQIFYYLVEMQDSVLSDVGVHTNNRMDQIRLWALQMEQETKRIFGFGYELLLLQTCDALGKCNGKRS